MFRHTLGILLHLLQDFQIVSDHFGTLCVKGVKLFANLLHSSLLRIILKKIYTEGEVFYKALLHGKLENICMY